jgi:predicted TIM-barrel fold metal-dependent hydrolase
LEKVIASHPNLRFILGHVGFDFNKEGYDFTPEVYALAEKYPNVFLEISGFGTPFHDPKGEIMEMVLKSIKERRLIDRVLFGSDGPTVPGGAKAYLKSTLKAMDRVGYTADEAETVLARNAARIFKLGL